MKYKGKATYFKYTNKCANMRVKVKKNVILIFPTYMSNYIFSSCWILSNTNSFSSSLLVYLEGKCVKIEDNWFWNNNDLDIYPHNFTLRGAGVQKMYDF